VRAELVAAERAVGGGDALGIAASFATWGFAETLIPVSGGNRELLEGVTALLAVAVLVYVSNWIFHRSYIHHWKDYLQEKMDTALGTGSTLALPALAFAAVYREGFETVLFYQALLAGVVGSTYLYYRSRAKGREETGRKRVERQRGEVVTVG